MTELFHWFMNLEKNSILYNAIIASVVLPAWMRTLAKAYKIIIDVMHNERH